jgi:hypothetical protein
LRQKLRFEKLTEPASRFNQQSKISNRQLQAETLLESYSLCL